MTLTFDTSGNAKSGFLFLTFAGASAYRVDVLDKIHYIDPLFENAIKILSQSHFQLVHVLSLKKEFHCTQYHWVPGLLPIKESHWPTAGPDRAKGERHPALNGGQSVINNN